MNEPHDSPRRPWWSDDAITSSLEDTLGRDPFAASVAAVLEQIGTASTSTVVGVVGPWGSGKTSTLALTCAHLNADNWQVEWMNPWVLSGAEAITWELLTSIAAALPADGSYRKRASTALFKYGRYATGLLATVPGGGVAGKLLDTFLKESQKGNSLDRAAQDVRTILERMPHRVLIVMDDVDRLQPDELLALLKAIRALGRLPNIHYLLAYDQDTLINVLKSTALANNSATRARAYLEKIVTVPMDQPPTRPEQVDELLDSGIIKALVEMNAQVSHQDLARLAQEREDLLIPTMREPRQVVRFLTQVHAYLPLLDPSEVDVVDFLALTCLRTNYPRIYSALYDDYRRLVAPETNEAKKRWSSLDHSADLAEDPSRAAMVHRAVGRLFWLGDGLNPSESPDQRRRSQRVGDPDYADLYFALGTRPDRLSDATLTAAVEQWANLEVNRPESALVLARIDGVGEKDGPAIAALLRRLLSRTEDLSETQAVAVLRVILSVVPASAVPTSRVDLLTRILAHLLAITSDTNVVPYVLDLCRLETEGGRRTLDMIVNALRQVPLSGRAKPPAPLAELIESCGNLSWERLHASIRDGDDAPLDDLGGAIRWVEDVWGRDELDRRLNRMISEGTSLDAIAARFVEIGTDFSTGHQTMTAFNASEFASRVTSARIEREHERFQEVSIGQVDEDDLSWSNRRAVVAQALLRWFAEPTSRLRNLTPFELVQHRKLHDVTSDVIQQGGSEVPDLQFGIGVLLGPSQVARERPSHLGPGERDRLVEDAVSRSSITKWLREVAPRWHLDLAHADWATSDSQGTFTDLTFDGVVWISRLRNDRSSPLRVTVRIRVGNAEDGSPALQVSVGIGFDLIELDEQRHRGDIRHGQGQVPAALSLAEVHEVLQALLGLRRMADELWSTLVEVGGKAPETAETQLALRSSRDLADIIDLSAFRRVGSTQAGVHDVVFRSRRTSIGAGLWTMNYDDSEAAINALNMWTSKAGWRDLEPVLEALLRRRQ